MTQRSRRETPVADRLRALHRFFLPYNAHPHRHPSPLVYAVAACLQAAGIPAGQIVIWDRYGFELTLAGYKLNPDGPGVRCLGTGDNYQWGGWRPAGKELNALAPIRQPACLVVGDVLEAVVGMGWNTKVPGDSLLLSTDPVAHDAIGLELYVPGDPGRPGQGHDRFRGSGRRLAGLWRSIGVGRRRPGEDRTGRGAGVMKTGLQCVSMV